MLVTRSESAGLREHRDIFSCRLSALEHSMQKKEAKQEHHF
jgi:hypothetical protein